MQIKICTLTLYTILIAFSQQAIAQCSGKIKYLGNKAEVNEFLDNLAQRHGLSNAKIVFIMKVDSLGEIHSCHIRGSKELTGDIAYSISSEIEDCVNIKFLYQKFKWAFQNEKYVYVNYPFTIKQIDKKK